MNTSKISWSEWAPVVLRFGIAFVFLWFGVTQIMDQTRWVSLIPDFLVNVSGLNAETLVIMNGVFEVVFGVLLAIGIKVRIVAALFALHLLTIVFELGFTATGVRDIGLMFATLAIALFGPDKRSFDTTEPR